MYPSGQRGETQDLVRQLRGFESRRVHVPHNEYNLNHSIHLFNIKTIKNGGDDSSGQIILMSLFILFVFFNTFIYIICHY